MALSMIPLAPTSDALSRMDSIMSPSSDQLDSPFALRIATSRYAWPTRSGVVYSLIALGQVRAKCTVGSIRAAFVLTHADIMHAPKTTGAIIFIETSRRVGTSRGKHHAE